MELMVDHAEVSRRARTLAAAIEPVAGQVYFSRECHEGYAALGFSPSPMATSDGVHLPDGAAYFCSRGSVMGQVPGELVAAAFAVFNPEIVEATGEWTYEEGCLSLPGFAFEIVRPKVVTVRALDLEGNDVVVQGDELLGRVFLHEIDHLDGVLMLDRLDRDERKRAMRELREQGMGVPTPGGKRHAL